ncbi:MAG TPA: 2,3-bisphosphoglycerate-independent phosphoglycerate mutase [Acidobacteriota bacterium]|nr:2,3-bisphosphoglycerate-independent phosphoglycerate mutase [Acidobacteriota bacterium]
MDRLAFYRALATPSDRRILFMVLDGLGGLPHPKTGLTELETAHTPTLDELAAGGDCGLTVPVMPGVTPGSGPAHIALFGYDPIENRVGRGVLAALGVDFDLRPGDVAARINFCTLDDDGNVVDRRAGRIDDSLALPLAERLDSMELADGIECSVRHVKQYRACVILRGGDLDGRIADTDPQRTGVPPLAPRALTDAAGPTADLAARFIDAARLALSDQKIANGVLLRGFDGFRPLPSFADLYGLRSAAVASYPMYLGAARLAGMSAHRAPDSPDGLAAAVDEVADSDFVFVHYKSTDSRGEDGDFEGKVAEIEKADGLLARLRDTFDVIMVTGDHSTPARLRSHSWHPVPLLIHSDRARSTASVFGEGACAQGSLGHVRSVDVLPLVLAHAGRLRKFGA